MVCSNCNSVINENENFCPNCGTKIEPKKKNKIVIFVIITVISLIAIIATIFFIFNKKDDNKKYGSVSSSDFISYTYSEGGIPKFIDGEFSSITIKSSADVLKALEEIKDIMKFKDIQSELKLLSEETVDGITYYKYNQVYNEIPVYKQNIIVMVNNNKIIGLSGEYIPNINLDITSQKTKEEIEKIVKDELGNNPTIVNCELYVSADYENQNLVYVVEGYSDENVKEFIVDANTGEVLTDVELMDYSNVYSYTGEGLNNKTYTINLEEYSNLTQGMENIRYKFHDLERDIYITDYRTMGPVFSSIVSAFPIPTPIVVDIVNGKIDTISEDEEFIKSAITSMAHYATTYDYYKSVLGRNSYDNKGSKIVVNIGVTESTFSSKDLNNAVWFSLTNQMFIGNYNGKFLGESLDVLAHEFTHGVVQYTVNFANNPKIGNENQAFETGALSEGYADIMGSLIEGKNWTIAEDTEILRSISNPESYKNPSVKGGEYYYPNYYLEGITLDQFLAEHNFESVTDYDKGGIHQNSLVVSHAAYLMYEAGAFNSREEMAKVWYNSLFMLSSYANFEDCALAVIKSAKNLGLSNASIYKITKAFQDTKMLENKEYTLKGIISSGNEKLAGAVIEIYPYENNNLVVSTVTDNMGEYEVNITSGMYKIKVIKEGFADYEQLVVVNGDVNLNIELADENEDLLKNVCKTDNCVNFTMYYLEGNSQNNLKENFETFAVEKGSILDVNQVIDSLNDMFKSEMFSTDGKSFYITLGGISFEMAWYYKDTDVKFDWSKPVMQDTEIEMKLFDGIFDDDFFIDMSDIFK